MNKPILRVKAIRSLRDMIRWLWGDAIYGIMLPPFDPIAFRVPTALQVHCDIPPSPSRVYILVLKVCSPYCLTLQYRGTRRGDLAMARCCGAHR